MGAYTGLHRKVETGEAPCTNMVARTAFFGDIVDTRNNNNAITRIEYMTFRTKDFLRLFFITYIPISTTRNIDQQ